MNLDTAGRHIIGGDTLIDGYLSNFSKTHAEVPGILQGAGFWLTLADGATSSQDDTPSRGHWDGGFQGQYGTLRVYDVLTLDLVIWQPVQVVSPPDGVCIMMGAAAQAVVNLPVTRLPLDGVGDLCGETYYLTVPKLWLMTVQLPMTSNMAPEDWPEYAIAIAENFDDSVQLPQAFARMCDEADVPQWALYGAWPDTSGGSSPPVWSAPDEER